MAFVELVDEGDAGEASDLVEADKALRGYVPNYTRALVRRPDVYRAWRGLIGAITANMDERRYELATLAAARRLRSTYCALAHGKVLAEKFLSSGEVADLARGRDVDSLDEVDRAVLELADKVAADATAVERKDVERLRALGLSDADVLDVVLAAAARCFYSKTLDALGVEPDTAYADLPAELREALTVGRPIGGA
jgi:uncharacterized peroxidase-related enzyme